MTLKKLFGYGLERKAFINVSEKAYPISGNFRTFLKIRRCSLAFYVACKVGKKAGTCSPSPGEVWINRENSM
jgi:hypothetical protein